MPARHAILLTEHAAKHAHPERASRAEGSLLAASLPIPVRFTQLLSRRQPASITPCTCHYYENCRMCTNNSHSGTHLPDHDDHPCRFFSNTYEMQISQLFCFHIHANWGGCTPWRFYSPNTPLAGKARNLARPHPAFVTSLHLCFITSFFHYNRCASIRGS